MTNFSNFPELLSDRQNFAPHYTKYFMSLIGKSRIKDYSFKIFNLIFSLFNFFYLNYKIKFYNNKFNYYIKLNI